MVLSGFIPSNLNAGPSHEIPSNAWTRRGRHICRQREVEDHSYKRASVSSITSLLALSQFTVLQKFYTNFFIGNRNQPIFPLPYNLAWMNGAREGLLGLAADVIDLTKRRFGPKNGPGGAVEFYTNAFNPSIILGSTELRKGVSDIRVLDPAGQSARVRIYADKSRYNRGILDGENTTKVIDIPICNGMGFVSAEYCDLTPVYVSGSHRPYPPC